MTWLAPVSTRKRTATPSTSASTTKWPPLRATKVIEPPPSFNAPVGEQLARQAVEDLGGFVAEAVGGEDQPADGQPQRRLPDGQSRPGPPVHDQSGADEDEEQDLMDKGGLGGPVLHGFGEADEQVHHQGEEGNRGDGGKQLAGPARHRV
jgi:hypothetical protein